MTTGSPINRWTLIVVSLLIIIATGSIVTWSRHSRSQPIEISTAPGQEMQSEIYIGGEVNAPGFYPLKSGDRLEDILRAAGGTTDTADLSHLELYIPNTGQDQPQKVNINQAETWLLEALPGIGEVRAQAIIEYRQQNGRFRSTNELIKVEGIGATTYEKIKHLITVAD